jgi:tetratricopeptide (TPR) repeat protein
VDEQDTLALSLALMRRMLDVAPLQRQIMVRSLRPTADAPLLADISHVCEELEAIAGAIPAGAIFPERTSVIQQLADALNWRAIARRKADDLPGAVGDYQRAAAHFTEIGREDLAAKANQSIAELRVDEEGHVDEGLERLMAQLRTLDPGTLPYVRTQIDIGELLSQHGDDYEARKYLVAAETTLLAISPNPSEQSILGDLLKSLEAIEGGSVVDPAHPLPLATAMDTRALYQRLYFALARAYRRSDPDKSAAYEEKLRDFNRGKRSLTPDELEGLASGRLALDQLPRRFNKT